MVKHKPLMLESYEKSSCLPKKEVLDESWKGQTVKSLAPTVQVLLLLGPWWHLQSPLWLLDLKSVVLLLEGCLQLEWLQLVRVSSIKSCRDDQSMECFELILKMRFQAMLLLDQFTLVFKVWQPAELEESQQQKLSEVFWSWSLPGCQGERGGWPIWVKSKAFKQRVDWAPRQAPRGIQNRKWWGERGKKCKKHEWNVSLPDV